MSDTRFEDLEVGERFRTSPDGVLWTKVNAWSATTLAGRNDTFREQAMVYPISRT